MTFIGASSCSSRRRLVAPLDRVELDLAAGDVLAASLASQVRADIPAASGVKRQPRRTSGSRVVAVTPFDERDQHWRELAALVGEGVPRSAGPPLVR